MTIPLSTRLDLLAADFRNHAAALPDAYQAEPLGMVFRSQLASGLAQSLEIDLHVAQTARDHHASREQLHESAWRTSEANNAWLKARIETLQGMLIGHRAVRGVVMAGRAPNVVTRP